MDIIFIDAHENTVKKHGNFTCVECRKEGNKSIGKIPTYKNAISWRKDNCACDKHIPIVKERIKRQLQRDNEDYTEADYQIWLRL